MNGNLFSLTGSPQATGEGGGITPTSRTLGLREWRREAQRALKLLDKWITALKQRDLPTIDRLNGVLMEQVNRLVPPPVSTPPSELAEEANHLARQIRERLDLGYSIIYHELDYTHTLIAMITRATAEEEATCPSWACGSLMDKEA